MCKEMKTINEYIIEKLKLSLFSTSKYADSFIDLGLPSGTLWYNFNLGVDNNELSNFEKWNGNYYAWGEIKPNKVKWVWATYKFSKGLGSINKYCKKDNKVKLELNDDAAYKVNQDLRIPTREQIEELINNTTYEWVDKYNNISLLAGCVLKSKHNDKKLFIPACGLFNIDNIDNADHVYIMSNTKTQNVSKYYGLNLSKNERPQIIEIDRYKGVPIRPVKI